MEEARNFFPSDIGVIKMVINIIHTDRNQYITDKKAVLRMHLKSNSSVWLKNIQISTLFIGTDTHTHNSRQKKKGFLNRIFSPFKECVQSTHKTLWVYKKAFSFTELSIPLCTISS